jgi:hypothetical protein
MEDEIIELQQRCELLESVITDILDAFLTHDEGVDSRLLNSLSEIQKDFEKAQNTL